MRFQAPTLHLHHPLVVTWQGFLVTRLLKNANSSGSLATDSDFGALRTTISKRCFAYPASRRRQQKHSSFVGDSRYNAPGKTSCCAE